MPTRKRWPAPSKIWFLRARCDAKEFQDPHGWLDDAGMATGMMFSEAWLHCWQVIVDAYNDALTKMSVPSKD